MHVSTLQFSGIRVDLCQMSICWKYSSKIIQIMQLANINRVHLGRNNDLIKAIKMCDHSVYNILFKFVSFTCRFRVGTI